MGKHFLVAGASTVDIILRSDALAIRNDFLCLPHASKIEMEHIELDPGGSGHNLSLIHI